MLYKKGEIDISLFVIIEFVLLILVTAAFGMFISNLASDTTFERNYLARDLALMEHAIYASPNDISYTYQPNTATNVDIDETLLTYDQRQASYAKTRESKIIPSKIDLSLFDYIFAPDSIKVADQSTDVNAVYKAYAVYNAYSPDKQQNIVTSPKSLLFEYKNKILKVSAGK